MLMVAVPIAIVAAALGWWHVARLEPAAQAPGRLDAQTYPAQAAKSRAVPITYYSAVEPGLYDQIIAKYRHSGHAHTQSPGQGSNVPARR